MTRQKLLQLSWEVLNIHRIHQTLHLWISIYFGLYRSFSMEKISISWKTVKGTWNSSLLKKIKSFGGKKFGEDGIMKLPEKWQKIVEQNSEYVV